MSAQLSFLFPFLSKNARSTYFFSFFFFFFPLFPSLSSAAANADCPTALLLQSGPPFFFLATQPWQRESLPPHLHARSPPTASAASISSHCTFPPPAPPRLPSPRKFRCSFRIRRQSQEFPGSHPPPQLLSSLSSLRLPLQDLPSAIFYD
ncbi:hypothetical protein ABFS82_10G096400 [Erythranthe guttata]